jgi:hypothetical protein
MRGTAALRPDFVPAAGLLATLGPTESRQLDARLRDRSELERLRRQIENDLAELTNAKSWLTEHLELLSPADADWLAEAAKQGREKEREADAHFRPVIAALKDALEPPADRFEADVQQLLRDGIEVLEGWLAFYRGFHKMLARQAGERDASPKVLRARPVEGEVDHEALSREFIARFPKIRAALAE